MGWIHTDHIFTNLQEKKNQIYLCELFKLNIYIVENFLIYNLTQLSGLGNFSSKYQVKCKQRYDFLIMECMTICLNYRF